MILTPDDVGRIVAAVVCVELGVESQERCGGADAITTWVLALPDDGVDLERFSVGIDVLGWSVVPFFEQLFSRRTV